MLYIISLDIKEVCVARDSGKTEEKKRADVYPTLILYVSKILTSCVMVHVIHS